MTTRNDFRRQLRTNHTHVAWLGRCGFVGKTAGVRPQDPEAGFGNAIDPEAGFGAKRGKCCISVDSRIPLALWEKWSGIW